MVDDQATALLMTRFYQNLLGKRDGLDEPMLKAKALHEANNWLRNLTSDEVQRFAATLPGDVRGQERVRKPTATPPATRPFQHPYNWSAFILIGHPN